MSLRTRFSLITLAATLVLVVSAPTALAAAEPSSAAAPAIAPAGAAVPVAPANVSTELPLASRLLGLPKAAPQYTFLGCPIESFFVVAAPSSAACYDGGEICTQLCADGGGTFLTAATSTGADCSCFCCGS